MKPKLTNDEWERIVEDAFSADTPDPPFSPRYRARRRELERMVTMKENRKITFQPGLAAATAAALLIAAVPAGLIWKMHQTKITPPPETPVGMEIAPAAAVSMPMTEETTEQIDNSFKSVEYGWLPEGMYLHEDGAYAGKIHSAPGQDDPRIITPEFYRMPEGTDLEAVKKKVQEVLRQNSRQDDGAAVSFGNAGETNRQYLRVLPDDNGMTELWMPFEGTPYMIHLYYQGIAEEEMQKVLKNLHLVPAGRETAGLWVVSEPQDPEELEFIADGTISMDDAGKADTPWQGKVLHESEIEGFTLQEVHTATARKGTESYPALQMVYTSGDKLIDLMYTSAPAEDLRWEDTDADFDILEVSDFRICAAAWNCTADEIEAVKTAIIGAAGDVED